MKKQPKPVQSAGSPPDSEFEPAAIEVVKTETLQAIERAEIDIQIATAKRFPRSIERFQKGALTMATQDEQVAEKCVYTRPVGSKIVNGHKVIEYASGMSVRMAEIAASCFGNLRAYSTLIEATDRFVRCRGMAIDLENNYASSSECVEVTVTREGQPYSERMRALIVKVALSKARRDAIFAVVPRGLMKPVENAVRELLLGDTKSMKRRRAAVLAWMAEHKIDPARVWGALGIAGEADLDVKFLEILSGIRTAIKDGDTTIDDAFPPLPGTKSGEPGPGVGRALFDPKAKTGQAPAGTPEGGSTASPDTGTKSPDSGTAAPGTGTVVKKEYTTIEREAIIGDLKNKLLDLHVPESKAFDYLKDLNLVPQGVDELFACPTLVLDMLRPNLPKLTVPPQS
jgi:hypothetical protein